MEEGVKRRIIKAAARCDIGIARTVNQDRVFCSLEPIGLLPNLFIVADGMGGHKAGDLAASEALGYFLQYIREHSSEAEDMIDFMKKALEVTNRYVYYLSKESPDYEGMGTTFVAATILGDTLYCINVGDSRLYEIDKPGERPLSICRVTEDHSIVEMLIQQGVITEAEAKIHPQRNMITRAIGIDESVQIDDFQVSLTNVFRILMCSDGLSNMLSDLEMLSISVGEKDIEAAADRLVNIANESGGKDNISVILIDFEEGGGEDA